MSRTNLTFSEAYNLLVNDLPIKRKGWSGYWIWDKRKSTVMMHCKDGSVIDIRETDDVLFTLGNIACDDWELAVEESCPVLVREGLNNQPMEAA